MVATTLPLAWSILDSVSSVRFATQTDPYPDVIASGPFPTRIGGATGRPAAGLTSETLPSNSLATHTSPPATVTPAGPRPTGILSTTWWAELIRSRKSLELSVTHAAPAP